MTYWLNTEVFWVTKKLLFSPSSFCMIHQQVKILIIESTLIDASHASTLRIEKYFL